VTMVCVALLGRPISKDGVLAALRDFDVTYPDTNDYDGWLDKRTYKYALLHAGRLYPCKYILSSASGLALSEFSGGEQTNSKFRRLGLEVTDKP
jgi:5-methylcytosine-specific restriction protein A